MLDLEKQMGWEQLPSMFLLNSCSSNSNLTTTAVRQQQSSRLFTLLLESTFADRRAELESLLRKIGIDSLIWPSRYI
jgi:hypothetical protein